MKITKVFKIKFDEPDPHWLCADNLSVALHDYTKKSHVKFEVEEVTDSNLIYDRDTKSNYKKALEIVHEIRNTTSEMQKDYTIIYQQPDITRQVEIIRDLLDKGVHVEVVNSPVFLVAEDKSLVYSKEFWKSEHNKIQLQLVLRRISCDDFDLDLENCKSVFFCMWTKMEDTETIRLASHNKLVYALRG